MADSQLDLTDKSVLITGGTGSFGRRFAQTVLRDFRPRRLIIFSRDELKQHEMRLGGFSHCVPRLQNFCRFLLQDANQAAAPHP